MSLLRLGAARATILLLAAASAGCGVIFGGTSETVGVRSDPDGVALQTQPYTATYTTPVRLELQRKHTYTIVASKDGYEPVDFHVRQEMRPWVLVGDIVLGLVGVVVDGITGAWWRLEPDEAVKSLVKADPSVAGPERIRVAVDKDDADDDEVDGVQVRADAPGVTIRVVQN